MNESILKALMRLFAIVADVDKQGHSGSKLAIVMDYLDRQYSHELVQTYIEYFEKQVKLYHPEQIFENSEEADKQKLRNEMNIVELCNQINEELEREQKNIVLVYLLDFIHHGDGISDNELKNIESVARHLKLPDDEFQDVKAFTLGDIAKVTDQERLLMIDANEAYANPDIKHMQGDKMEGFIVVLHLPSTNTFVFRYYGNLVLLLNGHNIKPNRSYIWSTGSVLRNPKMGSLYYSRVSGRFIQANVENKFVFTADDIEYNYRNSTNGIKRFNLSEESGRLIGIIGGSGSGKSTLLNVLNGNIKPKSGNVRINGHDIHEEKELVEGVIGYVPQDDLLIKELTVFQNLYFDARLCFADYTEDQLKEVVEKALIDFDLVEARDLSVGDAFNTILSGGQRKRLNIALELIREPSILFVDEPTSGLSSADSEKVVNLLKRQTFKGRLVFANMHQPSSDLYKMIDKLLVMDQGGRVIYYGHPISAITYFKRAAKYADAEESECLSCGNINTDQILRIVESRVVDANGRLTRKRKTSPQEWYDMYVTEIDAKVKQIQREHDDQIPQSSFKIPKHFEQFKIFLERDILSKFHNKQYLLLNAIEAPVLALILSFFTKKYTFIEGIPKYIFGENPNIPAFLFMAVIVSLFLGLVVSAEEIFKDRKILKREKFLNLSRSSYLFSKIIILFSLSAIQALIFVLIGNSMLEIKGMVFWYWLILFTTSCWANMIGLNISSGLNSVVTIYILVPLILVPQLLFSGVVVDFNNMYNKTATKKNVPLIGNMMTSRWAYEAITVTQFKDNSFEKIFYEPEAKVKNAIYYRSYCIPELRRTAGDCAEQTASADTIKKSENLKLVRNELTKLALYTGWSKPVFFDSLYVKRFTQNTCNSLNDYLDGAEKYFIMLYNGGVKERESKYEQQVKKLGSEKKFNAFKSAYFNNQLASVVTNEKDFQAYDIQNNEIRRLKDAVYHEPISIYGNAHYYAPLKKIGLVRIDTFWYNMAIIWLFSIVLFVVLYYDILRKVIAYFEAIRLNRANRRRFLRLLNITDPQNFSGRRN